MCAVAYGDDLFEVDLLLRIPRGEFSDDAAMLDPRSLEMSADALRLRRSILLNLDTAVVYIAGKKVGVLRDAEEGRVKPGAADDHQSHPVDLVLDDGICGDGGAEDDPFESADGFLVDHLRRDLEEGGQEILFVGEDLGLFSDGEVVDENRIRMSSPHIYTQDHDPTSSTLQTKFYIMRKLS